MGNQRAQRRVLMSYNPEHTVCYGGARLLDIDGEWLVNDVFVARSYAKALRQLGTELVLRGGAVGVLSPASTAGRIAARSAGLPLIKKNPAPERSRLTFGDVAEQIERLHISEADAPSFVDLFTAEVRGGQHKTLKSAADAALLKLRRNKKRR
jgi:hypothetical protein